MEEVGELYLLEVVVEVLQTVEGVPPQMEEEAVEVVVLQMGVEDLRMEVGEVERLPLVVVVEEVRLTQ